MKTQSGILARAACLALLAALKVGAQSIQQWDFENGNLNATVGGLALQYRDASSQSGVSFGTTTSFTIPNINGAVAKVAKINGFTAPSGIIMPLNTLPNGGGSLVNDYTIIFDILYPTSSDKKKRALVEADPTVVLGFADADLIVGADDGIGVAGSTTGNVTPNEWHRIAFVVDVESEPKMIRKYIDGVLVGSQTMPAASQGGGVDGRWAIDPGIGAALFTDDNGEVAPAYVNSIQFQDRALNTGQILALGKPSVSGVQTTIPPIPVYIDTTTPAVGDIGAPPKPSIEVILNAGDSTVAAGSVRLLFDDVSVPATVSQNSAIYTIHYDVPSILDPESVHKVTVGYTENGTAKTTSYSFTILKYQNVTLPAPFYFQDFESLQENPSGPTSLPQGWTVSNKTTPEGADYDLDVRSSKSFEDWALISGDRFNSYNSDRTALPPIVLNGVLLDSLTTGNLMWAESDSRCGSATCEGQYQELYTADIDCTGRKNVYLAFHSIYEQNQDNMDAAEYSIDGGATWLPALYLFCTQANGEQSDILYKDAPVGSIGTMIDAVATFARTDNNRPWGPLPTGASYGSMIKAPVSDALAPFIKPYINDDTRDGKRIEIVRLAQADGKKVRLRFLNTGTSAWFWGIDDLGLYEINTPVITTQPAGATIVYGGTVSLKVVASSAQNYQWQLNGVNIPGQTNDTLSISNAVAANAGTYKVIVRNADGFVSSAPAVLNVIVAPDITTQPADVLVTAGAPASFTAAVRGKAPFSYQWQKNTVNIPGATNATFSIGSTAAADAADYRLVISNDAGVTTTSVAKLTVLPLTPLTQDLVLHLPFDADSNDTSGKGNNGAPEVRPEIANGKLPTYEGAGKQAIGAGAIHITDGQAVSLGNPADLSFGADVNFTISFWVKGASGAWTDDPSFIGTKNWTSGGNAGYVIAAQGNGGWKWNWKAAIGPRRDTPNAEVLTDNKWHNLIVSHDRKGLAYFYLDGVLKRTVPIANDGDIDTTFPTYIGQDGTGGYGFNNDTGAHFKDMYMDDFGIWRRILTPQEAASIYAHGLNGEDLTKATGEVIILPPSATAGPANQLVSVGANVTLSATVEGTAPFTYQWQKDNVDIPGANSATLALNNITAASAGDYKLKVTNSKGTSTSPSGRISISSAPLSSGLVSYLKFDGDYSDASGRGNAATAVGGPVFDAGKLGQALRVTTVAGGSKMAYASLGTNADLQVGASTDFTISFWLNVTSSASDPSIIANKDWGSSSNPGWGIFEQGGGNLRINLTGTPGSSANRFSTTSTPNVRDGNWHHVLVTFWRGVAAMTFVDGQLINNSVLIPTGTADTGLPLNIGQDGTGKYSADLNALIDDLAFWRRALTAQEAASIYTAGTTGGNLASLAGIATLNITKVARSGNNIAITVNDTGTVHLEKKAKITDATWTPVNATPVNGVFTVASDGEADFFRAAKP